MIKGTGKLVVTHETIVEAVQRHLDLTLVRKVRVTSVELRSGPDMFHVAIEEIPGTEVSP